MSASYLGLGYWERPQEAVTYGLVLPSDSEPELVRLWIRVPGMWAYIHGPHFETRGIDKRMTMHC